MSGLHYRADGGLDMRYSSSRAYVASSGESSSNSGYSTPSTTYSNSNTDSSNLHYRADGGLDMRYSSSRAYVASSGESSSNSGYSTPSTTYSNSNTDSNNLHHRKDGQLDMRYKSSKAYVASHDGSSSNCGSSSCSTTSSNSNTDSSNLHYRKDGQLDMRYKSSKAAIQQSQNSSDSPKPASSQPSKHPKQSIKPPAYENGLPKRKDGFLDMRYKLCKEYAQLPKDSNGEIDPNSDKAQEFRRKYEVNPKPSAHFNFDSMQPLNYTGQNADIQRVIDTANHAGTKHIGRVHLFHATTKAAAQQIMSSKQFKPGRSGMFGGAIYFADSKKAAKHKAARLDRTYLSENAFIQAIVDMGRALIVEGPNTELNLESVRQLNCNSVLGRSGPLADWEYVVYEPSRIQPLEMIEFENESKSDE